MVEKWLIKVETRSKSVETLALIPNDVGLGPIFTDLSGKGDEHEEHEVETREIRGQTQG